MVPLTGQVLPRKGIGWDGEAIVDFEVKERTREKRKFNASGKFVASLSHYVKHLQF